MPSPAIGLSPLALLVGRRLEGHAVVLRGSVPEVMRESASEDLTIALLPAARSRQPSRPLPSALHFDVRLREAPGGVDDRAHPDLVPKLQRVARDDVAVPVVDEGTV